MPVDLKKALSANSVAKERWADLTLVSRMDFISWIETAKQEETRKRRIRIAIEKLVKGMRRPCCYAVVPMDLYRSLGTNAKAKAKWSELDAIEKRGFSGWVSSADKEARKLRVEKAVTMIAAGKKHP